MSSFSKYQYVPVDNPKESLEESDLESSPSAADTSNDDTYDYHSSNHTRTRLRYLRILIITAAICMLTAFAALIAIYRPFANRYPWSPTTTKATACQNPVTRHEWRTLSPPQQEEYISAVQCLQKLPSRIGMNHSMHEEFTWIHSRMGNFSHTTSAFIAWHRYFLHLYETTLQTECNYTGHLTYWDWSLDAANMTASPIWSPTHGFGGNGDAQSTTHPVGRGHCVTDGPWANLQLEYFSNKREPHCLSRGFIREDLLEKRFRDKIEPAALERVLQAGSYAEFNKRLEDGPHDAIPHSVRGDFSRETAPNDPVFFLHHTQLDRLWWKWQQRAPRERIEQYGSSAATDDDAATQQQQRYSLEDVFDFGDFAPARRVKEIMSTRTELLCYRYE